MPEVSILSKSNRSRPASKAKKPHPGFPLEPHPSGRWCKKVRGRFCYFGRIAADPKGESALTVQRTRTTTSARERDDPPGPLVHAC